MGANIPVSYADHLDRTALEFFRYPWFEPDGALDGIGPVNDVGSLQTHGNPTLAKFYRVV